MSTETTETTTDVDTSPEALGKESTETNGFEERSEIDIMLESQGITAPSEDELRGLPDTDDEDKSDTDTDTDDENKSDTDTEKKTDTEAETKAEDETKKDDTKEAAEKKSANSESEAPEKTPKGFVPLAAVHEARGEIRYLKEKIQDMEARLKTAPSETKAEVKLDDFEVLSDSAFEELAEDNPAQAAVYLRKLAIHETNERNAAAEEAKQAEFAKVYDQIIDTSLDAIEKVAPGIFKEDSGVQKELVDFAENLGFTEDLFYLTNPATKIILPGESEPLLLGEQAASILGLLVNTKAKLSENDPKALEKQLRTEITKQVTADLMKKFKADKTSEYRSINQVPKSGDETPTDTSFSGKVLTTAQYEKLSPKEQEQYLAGN